MSQIRFLLLSLLVFAQAIAGPKITSISPTSSGNNARIGPSPFLTITLESPAAVTQVDFVGQQTNVPFSQPMGNQITIASGALNLSAPGAVTVQLTYSDLSKSPTNHPFDYYTYQGDWLTYVPDQGNGNIYVFDFVLDATAPITTLTPPSTSVISSYAIAITPDGKYAYCTNLNFISPANNSLTIIDTAYNDNNPAHTKVVTFESMGISGSQTPSTIANSPDSNTLVVVDPHPSLAYKINVTNRTSPTSGLSGIYTIGIDANAVSFTPNSSKKAYVANINSGDISIIDLASGPSTSNPTIYTDTTIGSNRPFWIAPVPVNTDSSAFNNMVICDTPPSMALLYTDPLVAGSPQTPAGLTGTYAFNSQSQIVASPDSTLAYATNSDLFPNGNISIIDIAMKMQTATIATPLLSPLRGLAIQPDGEYGVLASSNNGDIIRFSTTSTDQTFISISGADRIGYSAITPDQAPVAYANYTVSGQTVTFYGSNSVSPTGQVNQWDWDFGDGHTGSGETVMHTYTGPGPFTATLTVTNTAGTSTGQTYFGQMMYNNGGPQARYPFKVCNFNLLPPSRATIRQKNACPFINTITIYPPSSGTPAYYLVYTNPKPKYRVAKVPASTNPVQVTVPARCPATCYYIFSQDVSGLLSCDYLKACIK